MNARVFSSEPGDRRFRRATDVVVLVAAFVALAVLTVAYPPGAAERRFAVLVAGLPTWVTSSGNFVFDLMLVAAGVLAATTVVSRRWFVALQVVASFVLAMILGLVTARLAVGHWPNVGRSLAGGPRAPEFPGIRLTEGAVVMLAVAPHLVRPLQTLTRWLLVVGFASAVVVGSVTLSGNVAALLIAVIAAAAIRLASGTSAGLPTPAAVARSLSGLRIPVEHLERSDDRTAGLVVFRAWEADGDELLIKVHGRDAYDNQLLEKFWRTLRYRDPGPSLRLHRGQAAEHEAFVTLLARSRGVPTHEVLAAGTTETGDAVVVLRGRARPLVAIPPDELGAGVIADAWDALEALHGANIAHRHIDQHTVVQFGDAAGIADFARATTTPRAEQFVTDRAQLLVTAATLIGSAPALDQAVAVLGSDGVAALVPYLQSAALEAPLLQATKAAGIDVDDLRKEAGARVGQEEPGLVRLRRVTWRSIVQTALLLLAAFGILSFVDGIDFQQFGEEIADASWAWILVGLVVAQTPRVAQAASTLGSVATDLRFGPVYALQLASSYLNLALPSIAARLAVTTRFFQRQGLSAASAITAAAIDSTTGTLLQVVLLVFLLIFSESTLNLQLEPPSTRAIVVIAIVALALFAALVVTLVVIRRMREVVVAQVRRVWPEIQAAFASLRSSNKLLLLVFGNLGADILFACALGVFAAALGTHVGLTDLLVINLSVSLFASFIPVPGGIGVTELGLTVGLTGAGMSEESALAAALLYRIAVFYLPPLWGFFALRGLQRRRYL
jgi:glycosyltransferase 2 family protein